MLYNGNIAIEETGLWYLLSLENLFSRFGLESVCPGCISLVSVILRILHFNCRRVSCLLTNGPVACIKGYHGSATAHISLSTLSDNMVLYKKSLPVQYPQILSK